MSYYMEERVEKLEVLKSLLLTLAIGLWIYWLWTRRFLYRFALKFPGLFGLPIFGAFGIRLFKPKNLFIALAKMFEDCKSYTICIWMGLYPTMLTSDPDIVERILSTTDFLQKAEFYRPLLNVKGGTLFATPADSWHQYRKVISPAFNHKVLLKNFPIFHKAKVLGLSKFDDMIGKGDQQIRAMLRRLQFGISVETSTGLDLKERDHNHESSDDLLDKLTCMIEHTMIAVICSYFNFDRIYRNFCPYNKSINYLFKDLNETILNRFKSRHDGKKNDNSPNLTEKVASEEESLLDIKKTPNIFIDHALDIYEKQQFSWNDIVCESATLIIASFESGSSVALVSIVMLAMHPEYQERLFDEIANFYPDKNFEMEYEHIKQLPYLTMVIKETLRLIPPVLIIGRHVVKDIQLTKDIFLPKDLQIMIDIFHLQRRTEVWGPNATKFDPDHFLPENLKDKHSYAFLPFSKGFRNCIGYSYSYYALSVLLAGFVRNFRYTTTFKFEDLQFYDDISIKFVVEPSLQVHRREA